MYESHFGISGLPFQLSPDPSFYFDSAGHHVALESLKEGLAQARGLVVVTGEVGAGKTTLVRAVLGAHEPSRQVTAQICSTQLDADELLRAVVLAFGIVAEALSAAELRPALDHFVHEVQAQGREPVLIVDEAQNLRRSAFELLLSLAASGADGRAGLRVCLLGQPELRAMLETGELVHVRRQVEVSCHLGPLDRLETGAYIEHRLRKVGWQGNPHFEVGAFDEIYDWTGGIPRRINMLCNRLLMSRFLASEQSIDAATVTRTAQDMRAEIGGETPVPTPGRAQPAPAMASRSAEGPRSATAPASGGKGAPRQTQVAADRTDTPSGLASRPLLCVVDSHGDHIKAASLLRGCRGRAGLPPVRLVRVSNNDALMLNLPLFEGTEMFRSLVNLEVPEESSARRSGEILDRFAAVLEASNPLAVLVFGEDAGLACALAANRRGVPVVRLGAGVRTPASSSPDEVANMLVDQLADLLLTCQDDATDQLLREGVPAERVWRIDNFVLDGLHAALRLSMAAGVSAGPIDAPQEFLADRHGYALVALNRRERAESRHELADIVATLRAVSRDLPIIWPVHPRFDKALDALKLRRSMAGERIACLPYKSHVDFVSLLNNATCVLSDSWAVRVESAALGIPSVLIGAVPGRSGSAGAEPNGGSGRGSPDVTRAVWECIFNGGARSSGLRPAPGRSAPKVADALADWLSKRGVSLYDNSIELQAAQSV